MTLVADVQELLSNTGITVTSDYINAMLSNIMRIIGDCTEPQAYEDYTPYFTGEVIICKSYPILDTEDITVVIDDVAVTPKHVDYQNGIIYLNQSYTDSTLECSYTVGYTATEIQADLVPILVQAIKDNNGGNLASINEGDVSVSYNTTGTLSLQLDNLIAGFKAKYAGCVVRAI